MITEAIQTLIEKNSLEDKIKLLAQANGKDYILNKLAEECAEYAAADMKIQNDGPDIERLANRGSELADICLLIEQLKAISSEEEKEMIRTEMKLKADRALTRMTLRGMKGE